MRGFRVGLAALALIATAVMAAGLPVQAAPDQDGVGLETSSGFSTVVISQSVKITEPLVEVAPDGTLYVHGPSGLLSGLGTGGSLIFRSDNGGGTWKQTPPGLRQLFPGGGDSDMAIEQDGTLHFTDLWLGSSTVSVSKDKGESWLASPIQGIVLQDRQWIATTAPDIVYHVTHQIPLGLVVSKSFNGGLLFLQHSVAASALDQTGCVCPPGHLVVVPGDGPLGTTDQVGVIYANSTGGVRFARSTDGGVIFTNVDVSPSREGVNSEASFPIVARAGGTRLVATWLEATASSSRAMFARSEDFGATWTPPTPIVSTGTSIFPWVDARGDKVVVSLYHTDATGSPGTVASSAAWFERTVASFDGGRTFGRLETVDAKPVKRGPICAEGLGCDGGRELGDFQSVALDNAGAPLFSYMRIDPTAAAGVVLMFGKGR